MLYIWLLANKLTLNVSKTHFKIFHRTRHTKYKIHIDINKVPIEQVKHTKMTKGVAIICTINNNIQHLYSAF